MHLQSYGCSNLKRPLLEFWRYLSRLVFTGKGVGIIIRSAGRGDLWCSSMIFQRLRSSENQIVFSISGRLNPSQHNAREMVWCVSARKRKTYFPACGSARINQSQCSLSDCDGFILPVLLATFWFSLDCIKAIDGTISTTLSFFIRTSNLGAEGA